MIYKIHFENQNGEADFVVVSGETINEIQEQAARELTKRNGKNPWSEKIYAKAGLA